MASLADDCSVDGVTGPDGVVSADGVTSPDEVVSVDCVTAPDEVVSVDGVTGLDGVVDIVLEAGPGSLTKSFTFRALSFFVGGTLDRTDLPCSSVHL